MTADEFGRLIEYLTGHYNVAFNVTDITIMDEAMANIPSDKIRPFVEEIVRHIKYPGVLIINHIAFKYNPASDVIYTEAVRSVWLRVCKSELSRSDAADEFESLDDKYPGRGLKRYAAEMRGEKPPSGYLENTAGD